MRCVRREAGRWRDRPPGMGWPGLDGCRITLLTVKSLHAALIASRRPPDPLNPHHLPAPAPPACRRTFVGSWASSSSSWLMMASALKSFTCT